MGEKMRLIIEGVPPYDGQYDLADGDSFTNREMNRIKVVSGEDGAAGLRGGEVLDALVAFDTAAYVAAATVLLERTGLVVDTNLLWNAQSGAIYIDADANGSAPLAPKNSSGNSDEQTVSEPSSGGASTQPGV